MRELLTGVEDDIVKYPFEISVVVKLAYGANLTKTIYLFVLIVLLFYLFFFNLFISCYLYHLNVFYSAVQKLSLTLVTFPSV